MMVDKILVSNDDALISKYGADGLQGVQAAIARLVAADQARGLQTTYVAVNDPAHMNAAGGVAVTSAADAQQNKNAVDALYAFHKPQYMVILGSPDVIPHQDLINPAYNPDPTNGDPDQTVPSDLPYACDAPYSQNVADFVGPGRVVSRLPDVTGSQDPSYLVHLLDLAANAGVLTHADYADYLGVSAAVWSQSTAMSLNAIFGLSGDMQSVPPASYQWPAALLTRRSHFFNCHGAHISPQYFGQIGASYPVAHDAGYIAGKLTPGTVASVECCYGAELYDPVASAVPMGIANVYMGDGAYGFWGSTTIAYGPADSNAQADLMCQYFLEQLLNGASLGRAALSARQAYVQNASAMGPVDLKTLGQFILLGDASIHCVPSADAAVKAAPKFASVGIAPETAKRLGRIERRQRFAEAGLMLRATKAVTESLPIQPAPDIRLKLEQIRAAAGLQAKVYASYRVRTAPEPKIFAAKTVIPQATAPTAFHLLFEGRATAEPRVKALRIVEVTEADGQPIRVREFFSR
jgi:hypothetical protein